MPSFLPQTSTIHQCHYNSYRLQQKLFFITAVRGYFTLAHSNIDRTDKVAVGGLTGSQFYSLYESRTKNLSVMVSCWQPGMIQPLLYWVSQELWMGNLMIGQAAQKGCMLCNCGRMPRVWKTILRCLGGKSGVKEPVLCHLTTKTGLEQLVLCSLCSQVGVE